MKQKKTIKELRITKSGLKEWLESKNSKTIVGKIHSGTECILANYMHENMKNKEDISLAFWEESYPNKVIVLDLNDETQEDVKATLPKWCYDFCQKIIDTGRKSTTAGKCLQILNELG